MTSTKDLKKSELQNGTVGTRENWLKVTSGLKCVKDGICTLTETVMAQFQQEIIRHINMSVVEACNNESCKRDCILNQGVGNFQCPNNVCDSFMKSITEVHMNKKIVSWKNCEVRCWPVKCWEIAKAYMPQNQSSANTGPATTDCSALLQLMWNCKKFRTELKITANPIRKV